MLSTSFGHRLKIKKIGHAGTLDPLATGLLIICTGKMTKQIDGFQAQEKEYIGKFVLGQTTPSCDLETEPGAPQDIQRITEDQDQGSDPPIHRAYPTEAAPSFCH